MLNKQKLVKHLMKGGIKVGLTAAGGLIGGAAGGAAGFALAEALSGVANGVVDTASEMIAENAGKVIVGAVSAFLTEEIIEQIIANETMKTVASNSKYDTF